MNAFALYAAVCVGGEYGAPDGLQYVHDGVVDDPVRVVWEAVDVAFLWCVYFKDVIRACSERPLHELVV